MLTKFMFARRDNVLLYARCRAPLVNKNYTQIKLQPSLNSTIKLDNYAVYIHFYLKSEAIDNRYDLEKTGRFYTIGITKIYSSKLQKDVLNKSF